MRALVLGMTTTRMLAVFVYWCAGLIENGLVFSDPGNGGFWIALAGVLGVLMAILGRNAIRHGSAAFLLGDGATGLVFLVIALMGGIPLGVVGLPVAQGPSFVAALMLLSLVPIHIALLKQTNSEAHSDQFRAVTLGLFGAGSGLLVGGIAILVITGYLSGRSDIERHLAERVRAHTPSLGMESLPAERQSLVLLAIAPSQDLQDASPCFHLCDQSRTLSLGAVGPLTGHPRMSGFRSYWIAGYRYALDTGADRDVLADIILADGLMARNEDAPVRGFFEFSQSHFGRPASQISDREFLALVYSLHSRGRITPQLLLDPPGPGAVEPGFTSTVMFERSCRNEDVREHHALGCALFERERFD